jgi:ADP-heptose:LPS heptosyltransferase
MKAPFQPKRILMLKAHSAGIGDLLRSTAAWRVLKNAYPDAELHLLLLTREPGYPSEELIRDHHLLNGFYAVDKRTPNREQRQRYWVELKKVAAQARPDLVIDFEPGGLRTTMISAWFAWRRGARTVGINSVAGRGLFYGSAAPSPEKFARQRVLPWPLEYTERDFVALAALGLERAGCPIELRETEAGHRARLALQSEHGLAASVPLLGLNIGCGTPDAMAKRPELGLLSELVAGLQRDHGLRLVLMGAPFEREINQEFCALHRQRSTAPILDWAGKTSISGLTGIINACTLFISTDSGPYHLGVALRAPTLAIFRWENRTHFHVHPWLRCSVVRAENPLPPLRQAAEELLEWKRGLREDGKETPRPPLAAENKS